MQAVNKFIAISTAVLVICGGALGLLINGLTGLAIGAAIGVGIMAVPASIFQTYARLGQTSKPASAEATRDAKPHVLARGLSAAPKAAASFNRAASRLKAKGVWMRDALVRRLSR